MAKKKQAALEPGAPPPEWGPATYGLSREAQGLGHLSEDELNAQALMTADERREAIAKGKK
jgi:hypothetical protein